MRISDYLDKSKVLDREIDRLTYARDASIYRIIPEFAVRPQSESDIKQLFKYAINENKSVTFRASGTSLSGQTITDGIIAEIAYNWQKIDIKRNGDSILIEPGVIGEHANQALKIYDKRIGPDPASIKAARIGGIIANNASGMTTGRPCNSYNTMRNIRFILANGNTYDTSNPEDYFKFKSVENELYTGLKNIYDKIKCTKSLQNKIINKYRLKNTIGYSLNAFTDYKEPLDIFAHLLIGSEGTLAFVSNIELETVPDPPYKSTGLILFDNIIDACNAIEAIKDMGVQGLELMDNSSLKTAIFIDDAPYNYNLLPIDTSALLCEFQEFDNGRFNQLESSLKNTIKELNGNLIGKFEHEENERLKLWKIRKSLFTTIGSMRKPGTSVITEDICFDIKNLGNVITDLHKLFKKWKYEDAVVFGHAKDGNLHFNLSIDLESKSGVKNYHKMMEEVVDITINKYNGSLKAEHGTGRNMAPFVEYEWGTELYKIMWQIKELADPNNILNRGVILNENKNIHIENLKPMPLVHDTIDLCVECGFCEPVCPSREFTFTPRNRITVSRELQLLTENKGKSKSLLRDYNFNTELTCAVDGMCEVNCPIKINTGNYVKYLRKEKHGRLDFFISELIVDHFKIVISSIGIAIKLLNLKSKIFGQKNIKSFFNLINKGTRHYIPSWNPLISNIKRHQKQSVISHGRKFIYYPSCISRTISADLNGSSIVDVMMDIARECSVKLTIPDKIDETCCGTPFSSKGFEQAEIDIFEKTIDLLYLYTNYGEYSVVVDTSTCTYKFIHPNKNISKEIFNKWSKIKFIDIIPFLNSITASIDYLPLEKEIILHPTCSTHKMGDQKILKSLALKCAKNVKVPENTSCCGFAGDRGLIIPELNMNAANYNKCALSSNELLFEGYSSSRMCEIGMSSNNQNYLSIALLVREYLIRK